MPRTPLLRALDELAQDHRDAERFGIRPEEARHSRREFLRRSATVGAVAIGGPALLSRSAHAATTARIAIVGGGIAGLNAALSLADSGIRSTVYESTARL